MRHCPTCGCPNEASANHCVRCGDVLSHSLSQTTLSPQLPGEPRRDGTTPLGGIRLAPVEPRNDGSAAVETAPATLHGPGPQNVGQLAPDAARPATLPGLAEVRARTLLGFGPVALPPGAPSRAAYEPAAPPGAPPGNTLQSAAKPTASSPPRRVGSDESTEHAPFPAAAPYKGTLLGIARPGIAPLNPGEQKPAATSEPPTTLPGDAERRHSHASAAALHVTQHVGRQRAAQRKRLAWILGSASALLLTIAATATVVWWNNVRLAVTVDTAADGRELLTFRCDNCRDGTELLLLGQSTVVQSRRAAPIVLANGLAIGENRLSVSVKQPGRSRGESVVLTVPVEFRVTADLSGLARDPPEIDVIVDAVPQTRMSIDGKTVVVGQDGRGRLSVELGQALVGPSAGVLPLERKLQYVITQRNGTTVTGSLVAQTGITALELDSPGLGLITRNPTFALSGRTTPNAAISANGHPIPVQPDGTFNQDMALSAPGATWLRLRAQAAGMAPRIINISLERTTELPRRARELGEGLFTSYDAIVSLLASKPNSTVALHGEVEVVESAGQSTRLVVSASCLQAPCLASIRHGASLHFERGDRVIAIGPGRLTKRLSGDSLDLAIDAQLVVEEHPNP